MFFWPRKRGAFGSVISMGKVDDYAVGSVTYKIDGKFYLVRLAQGFIALFQTCPHLGCTVPWRETFTWDYEGERHHGAVPVPVSRLDVPAQRTAYLWAGAAAT